VDDIPAESDVAARLMILKGIVKLNGLTIASDVLRAIATNVQVTGAAALEKALIGAVVAASVQQAPITATLVAETLARQTS
jgi:chromosomal replication initiation ATPase DnaA